MSIIHETNVPTMGQVKSCFFPTGRVQFIDTLFFCKSNFIKTASLVFAKNQEQLRSMSLKFEKEKIKKGKRKSKKKT